VKTDMAVNVHGSRVYMLWLLQSTVRSAYCYRPSSVVCQSVSRSVT